MGITIESDEAFKARVKQVQMENEKRLFGMLRPDEIKLDDKPRIQLGTLINSVGMELVQKLNINLIDYREFVSLKYCQNMFELMRMPQTWGAYNPGFDVVAINENAQGLHTETLLHEIIHWTGHESRLARKRIVNGQRAMRGERISLEDMESMQYDMFFEETIAQLGAWFLARSLGLECSKEFEEHTKMYLAHYDLGNAKEFDRAQALAKEASAYVLKLAGLEDKAPKPKSPYKPLTMVKKYTDKIRHWFGISTS